MTLRETLLSPPDPAAFLREVLDSEEPGLAMGRAQMWSIEAKALCCKHGWYVLADMWGNAFYFWSGALLTYGYTRPDSPTTHSAV